MFGIGEKLDDLLPLSRINLLDRYLINKICAGLLYSNALMPDFMKEALELARQGVGRTSLQPLAVGAVVVKDDQVVGRGSSHLGRIEAC